MSDQDTTTELRPAWGPIVGLVFIVLGLALLLRHGLDDTQPINVVDMLALAGVATGGHLALPTRGR